MLHFAIMKYLITSILLITATLAFSGITGLLTQSTRDWNFIQSVGGMKVSAKQNVLHVDCHVSGTKKVTVKPTTVNSALMVRRINHKRVGKTIQLRLVTSVIEKGVKNNPKQVDLSAYPVGEYSVQYVDSDGTTHPLGKIKLSAEKKDSE